MKDKGHHAHKGRNARDIFLVSLLSFVVDRQCELARALVVVLAAAALTGCGRPTEVPLRPEQVLEFSALYSANCSGCHGEHGRHGVAQPLNDPTYLALVGNGRLRDVISRGVRGTPMAAFAKRAGGTLTDEQVGALADGLQRQWGSAERLVGVALPPYSADDAAARGAFPDARRGQVAYVIHCARCHGADGRGGPSAGSVVDEAYLALTSDQALRTTIITGRPDENIPGWREYVPGRPMTDQEISDVVAWLSLQRGNHD